MFKRLKWKFTLIELLIVVAIISILVSLLLPSLNRARYTAKNAVCLSDQSQFAKVLTIQANDNNEKFHDKPNSGTSPHDSDRSFVEAMEKLGMQTRNFMCVFRPRQYADDNWLKGIYSVNRGRLGFGYWVIRDRMINPNADIWSSPFISKNSSDHMLLSDTMFKRSGNTLFDEGWGTVHHGYSVQNQGMNKIFADGHGKIIHQKSMSVIYTTHVDFYGKK